MYIQWSTKTEQPRNRQQPAITRHNKQNGKLLKQKKKTVEENAKKKQK